MERIPCPSILQYDIKSCFISKNNILTISSTYKIIFECYYLLNDFLGNIQDYWYQILKSIDAFVGQPRKNTFIFTCVDGLCWDV